jgi:ParB family chromosome partitioning protein
MPKPKGGLGRGLSALIPQGSIAEGEATATREASVPTEGAGTATLPNAGTGLLAVPLAAIEPNPRQPRQSFPVDRLEELADSIKAHGIIQPLIVTIGEEHGRYYLVAGERRWRAAMLAGLESVPVVVKEASPRAMLEMALVENIQRADLNPLEEAAAFRSLIQEFGLKQDEVASRVGKSRTAVTNLLRLFGLPRQVQDAIAAGLISEGQARPLLQIPNESLQLRLLKQIVEQGLTVRQIEALARRLAENPTQEDMQSPSPKPLYDESSELEDRFRSALSTKVSLSRSRRGGKLVIYFSSDEELDRIYGTIVGEDRHL